MTDSFDLETFLAQPRLAGLALSPDGDRLVVGVATPAPDGKRFKTALWQLDPTGGADPRRLTRSASGEAAATFAADGSLLFTSARPDPDVAEPDTDPAKALWRLPVDGGEPQLLAAPDAGAGQLLVADDAPNAVVAAEVFPDADTLADDAQQDRARSDAGVSALLFEGYPIRHWDHWLGPREPGLWQLTTDPPDDVATLRAAATRTAGADDTSRATDRATDRATGHDGDDPHAATDDAAPDPAPAGDESLTLVARGPRLYGGDAALSPDGTTLVVGWRHRETARAPSDVSSDLVAIDLATGERRVLIADGRDHSEPAVSPDGRMVAAVASDLGAPDRAQQVSLELIDLTDGTTRQLAADLDLWPSAPAWLPSGDALVFTADEHGHRPVFRVELATGEVTRLTAAGAYSDVCVTRDGATLYALHATVASPPRPVRLDTSTSDQSPTTVPSPAGDPPQVADVERLVTTADDGVEIASWLVLPRGVDGPAPLVTMIHGGPLGSWNSWHWRWCPHVLADAGYAVLLPDPALSTGYGQAFIERGWGRWGERPYTDVMACVDAAAADPRVDEQRLAAAGGSFGGYLANWIAGHTDRFAGIITHASLWALPGFHGTTDLGLIWEREFGDPYVDASRYVEHSPDRHVGSITTPMLVIHGETDLRVPISEALTLWTDLQRHGVDARLLYFPDENHWILKPQHVRLWYQAVLGFLDEQLRGEPFERPPLL